MSKTMRVILIIVGVVILLGGALFAWGYFKFKPDAKKVAEFIADNPERTAIYWIRNDSVMASLNSDSMQPLASTMKIIIAIEFAEQAAAGLIDPDEPVALETLERYYVPNTDGGAHKTWLGDAEDQVHDGTIALREVVKGMIKFSSNANTEYLQELLGLDRINARIDSLGIERHDPIYYVVSSLFVGKHLYPGQSGNMLKQSLLDTDMATYRQACVAIHDSLKNDTTDTYRTEISDLSMKLQRVWSDRLPASTAKEYAQLMEKINDRNYFSPEVYNHLTPSLEWLMENENNQEWLKHSGAKGGSTAFVLTKALYATDKEGNTTEMAYFLTDLSPVENVTLLVSMNAFELNILNDAAFRKEAKELLAE